VQVTLIDYTEEAAEKLIFSKSTRLNMQPGLFDQIKAMSEEEKLAELEYMSKTIPSSWEFINYTFLIRGVSRAFTHQFVRSRQCSFAQQSMRVTDQCDFDYVYPQSHRMTAAQKTVIDRALDTIKDAYVELGELGMAVEDRRGILPTNIATNIMMRCNMRTFVELAKSRLGGRTQSEYQDVVEAMVGNVLLVHPWMDLFLFGDKGRNYFDEIEQFAEEQFGGDLFAKGALLKIVDAMRKGH